MPCGIRKNLKLSKRYHSNRDRWSSKNFLGTYSGFDLIIKIFAHFALMSLMLSLLWELSWVPDLHLVAFCCITFYLHGYTVFKLGAWNSQGGGEGAVRYIFFFFGGGETLTLFIERKGFPIERWLTRGATMKDQSTHCIVGRGVQFPTLHWSLRFWNFSQPPVKPFVYCNL